MAYARYGQDCDWYIFWDASADSDQSIEQGRASQRLAIWHKAHRAKGASFSYLQIAGMLRSRDYSEIPGYTVQAHALISTCLDEFIADVDAEEPSRAK